MTHLKRFGRLAGGLFLMGFATLASPPERPSETGAPGLDTPPTHTEPDALESRYVEVLGARMHYVEVGQGAPILFVHGQPTSSYLWRNIIPYVQGQGRAIAVDLIGMGRSDKPPLEYRYADHAKYLEAFIEALGLEDITLVAHDWGSVLGFDYAMRNESRVSGLAFMEALIPPAFPLPALEALPQPARDMFAGFRDPVRGRTMLIDQNLFIEQMLPGMVLRTLTAEEMNAYRAPFLEPSSREPLYRWPNEVPIAGHPADMDALIRKIGAWLTRTDLPKLHLYASPGAINPPEFSARLAENFKNIETAFVGPGLHFIQEDQPEAIGRALSDWLRRLRLDSPTSRSSNPKLNQEQSMSAFLTFHSTINDTDKFMHYAKAVGPTLEPFDGQVILKGKAKDVFAGEHAHQSVGVLQFPDYESAKGWYESDAYQSLVPNRDEAASITVIGYEQITH